MFSLFLVMFLGTVTVKVDEKLKMKMGKVRINWSEYVRESIQRRIELEERRSAGEKLLGDLKAKKNVAPKGFINEAIREMRKSR